MVEHTWRECRPTVLTVPGDDPESTEALRAATQRVWVRTPPQQKRMIHQHLCLDRKGADQRRAWAAFVTAVDEQARADHARHAKHAGQILDFMEQAGAQTLTPEPGQEIVVAIMRVADSMILGDDPPPRLALRRQIVNCSECGEKCFLDPLSYEPATPIPVCLHCLPQTKDVMKQLVADARAQEDAGGTEDH
jgi:hypothetical protein